MSESNYFALMIDETTDCTVTEQLSKHGRLICKSTGRLSHFLIIINLLHSEVDITMSEESSCIPSGVETVTKRVMEYVEGAELGVNKLRGIGTDGASTLMGVKTGVVARLKGKQPSLIGVSCAGRRVNLASTQVGNTVPYVKTFGNIFVKFLTFLITALCALLG